MREEAGRRVVLEGSTRESSILRVTSERKKERSGWYMQRYTATAATSILVILRAWQRGWKINRNRGIVQIRCHVIHVCEQPQKNSQIHLPTALLSFLFPTEVSIHFCAFFYQTCFIQLFVTQNVTVQMHAMFPLCFATTFHHHL